MSGFSDSMIDDGFSDPQEYLDYLCENALNNSEGDYYYRNNDELSDEYDE